MNAVVAGWLLARLRGCKPLLAAMIFVLLLGMAMGLAAPKAVNGETLATTRLLVGNYIQALPHSSIEPWQESKEALLLNGGLLLILAVCGLHLLGMPLVIGLLFLKGLSLGYAMGFLMDYQGISGFAIIFLSMLPQNLLLLPALVMAAYVAACFSLTLIRAKQQATPLLAGYGLRFTLLLLLVILACLVQGYICPLLLKMFFVLI